MATTPFYKIMTASGRDITENIEGFSYEESQEKDDIVSLTVRDASAALDLIGDKELMNGARLTFIFGIVGGVQSARKIAVISTRNRRYTNRGVSLDIQATDLGLSLKKVEKSTVWNNKTISEIVQSIAESNGLEFSIDPTTQRYDYLPQQNKTDWQFIKYLAGIEKNGSVRFFIHQSKLYFTRLKLDAKAARLFDFATDGNVISFTINENGGTQSGAAKSVEAVSYDPINDKIYKSKSENGTTRDDVKLAEYDIVYNADGVEVSRKPALKKKGTTPEKEAGKIINVVGGSGQETQNTADKLKKEAALKALSATLTTYLDATLEPDTVITVSGVGAYDTGNYYVMSVRHEVKSGSPAVSVLELNRNATKIKNAEDKIKNPDPNVKPAPGGKGKKVVEKAFYGADKNLVRREKTEE